MVESARRLHAADTCLFDLRARPEFRQVAEQLAAGQPVAAEVNGRRIWAVGTTAIGASFAVNGNLVTSDANFARLFPGRPPGSIDVGVVRLRPGADKRQVQAELRALYGPDLLVLTIDELADRAKDFLLRSRPINFIFGLGAAVGFLIGFAIVYQVLFTDVSNHLPQYATLKAIGYSDGYLRRIVLEESLILSVLGFLPGAAMAWGLYAITVKATNLPLQMTAARGALIFGLTVAMCGLSAMLAMRRAPAGGSGGCVLSFPPLPGVGFPVSLADPRGPAGSSLTRFPSPGLLREASATALRPLLRRSQSSGDDCRAILEPVLPAGSALDPGWPTFYAGAFGPRNRIRPTGWMVRNFDESVQVAAPLTRQRFGAPPRRFL